MMGDLNTICNSLNDHWKPPNILSWFSSYTSASTTLPQPHPPYPHTHTHTPAHEQQQPMKTLPPPLTEGCCESPLPPQHLCTVNGLLRMQLQPVEARMTPDRPCNKTVT